jgi:hypothetical protein
MTISIILVLIACLSLLFLVRLTTGRSLTPRWQETSEQQLRIVDVEAFRNLIDPAEEEFLRASLPRDDFRQIQRERLRAAVEYISTAAGNAALLLRIGEAARRSADPSTVAAAEKLIDHAIQLRLYAFRALPRLYLAMVLPGTSLPPARVAESYEQMTRQVILLGLRTRIGGVPAA